LLFRGAEKKRSSRQGGENGVCPPHANQKETGLGNGCASKALVSFGRGRSVDEKGIRENKGKRKRETKSECQDKKRQDRGKGGVMGSLVISKKWGRPFLNHLERSTGRFSTLLSQRGGRRPFFNLYEERGRARVRREGRLMGVNEDLWGARNRGGFKTEGGLNGLPGRTGLSGARGIREGKSISTKKGF